MPYLLFEATVYTLLAANAVYFLFVRTATEALDSVAWLTLLILFEVETRWPGFTAAPRTVSFARALRPAAAAAIVVSTLAYAYHHRWLDAFNSALWVAVVALLEAEVRYARALALHRQAFRATAMLLYGALASLVVLWLVRKEWFDAYDAALWLIAFATIENDVLTARERAA